MGARTYCQDIGRFLQPDPLFEAFARHTPYHYSFNSPLVWLDPSGLAPEKEKGEERLQAFLDPVIFEQMEQVYSYQIIIMKSRLTEMMIRSEILGILKTISDSYYGGNIPDNGIVDLGSARVAWSSGSKNGHYWMDVKVSQDGIEVNYSERGTIGKNGQLNISSILVSTKNIDKADAAGWLSGVHKGIKGNIAKEKNGIMVNGKYYSDRNAIKNFIAIVAGESSNLANESTGIGEVMLRRMELKNASLEGDFISLIGGINQFDAIGKNIYNNIMNMTWDEINDGNNIYRSRIDGAARALSGLTNFSNGAFFWNASSPKIGFNWNMYNKGIFEITSSIGKTTFFKYNPVHTSKRWP